MLFQYIFHSTFHNIPLLPQSVVFVRKENLSCKMVFYELILQTNQLEFIDFSDVFIFFRQLLLIGGVDPVEDIQKFKLDG